MIRLINTAASDTQLTMEPDSPPPHSSHSQASTQSTKHSPVRIQSLSHVKSKDKRIPEDINSILPDLASFFSIATVEGPENFECVGQACRMELRVRRWIGSNCRQDEV